MGYRHIKETEVYQCCQLIEWPTWLYGMANMALYNGQHGFIEWPTWLYRMANMAYYNIQ